MALKYKNPCPDCFSETGHSIVMKDTPTGNAKCPNCNGEFSKDEDGFWKRKK
jgi:hypothetical protein